MSSTAIDARTDSPATSAATPSDGVTVLRYGIEDKPPPIQSLFFGLQHVLVMFAAMVAAPLVISQVLNLSPELRTTMLSGVILGCGLSTIVSALGLGWIGARLPMVLGSHALYISLVIVMSKTVGLNAITTVMITGGLVLFALSPAIGKLRRFFPPLVVGTLLIIIGITLMRIAVNVATAANTPNFGKPVTLSMMIGSIFLILAINRLTTGVARSLSMFLALVCVYLVCVPLGLVNFSAVAQAPWFRIPTVLPYGPLEWPGVGALVTVLTYHLIAAISTMSIIFAVCRMVGVEGSEARVRGAIALDGIGSSTAALFGGVPLVTYDQNVGAISLTGVGSRYVVAVAGGILVVMALLPKVGAVIGIVPSFVLGGALIFMFAMIMAIGVGILAESMKGQRNALIVTTAVGLSTAINFLPASFFEMVPGSLRVVLSDAIVVGTLVTVALNIILPQRD